MEGNQLSDACYDRLAEWLRRVLDVEEYDDNESVSRKSTRSTSSPISAKRKDSGK